MVNKVNYIIYGECCQ